MPIRRGRITVRTWRVAIPATAGVLVLAIVVTTAGAERRVSANDLLGDRPARTPVLSAPEPPPDGARTIMVVGNSVGWFLGDALEKSPPRSPPVVGLNAAFPACAYPSAITGVRMEDTAESLRLETSPCDHLWEWNIGYLRPDIVLIVLATPIGNLEYHGAWTSLCTPTFDREYRRELADAVRLLGSAGARVALTTAAYVRLAFNPDWDRQVDCDNKVRRHVSRATGTQLVDLFSYTCPRGECRDTVDGVNLRPDGVHYSGPSAPIVNAWIVDQLATYRPPRATARLGRRDATRRQDRHRHRERLGHRPCDRAALRRGGRHRRLRRRQRCRVGGRGAHRPAGTGRAGRRHERRRRRPHDRRHGPRVRAPRRAVQQRRRRRPARPARRLRRCPVRPPGGAEPEERLPRDEARAPGHAPRRERLDREHRVGGGPGRVGGPRGVLGDEGWRRAAPRGRPPSTTRRPASGSTRSVRA